MSANKNTDIGTRATAIVAAILIIIIAISMWRSYRSVFGGGLSDNPADWANMSSFFYGILTVLLTALNVYLFYKLTRAANEINERNADTNTDIIETFTRAEERKTNLIVGLNLLNQYTDAHNALMKAVQTRTTKKNFNNNQLAIQRAATKLYSVYSIIISENNFFEQTKQYNRQQEYVDLLKSLCDNTQYQERHEPIEDAHEPVAAPELPVAVPYIDISTAASDWKASASTLEEHYNNVREIIVTDLC